MYSPLLILSRLLASPIRFDWFLDLYSSCEGFQIEHAIEKEIPKCVW